MYLYEQKIVCQNKQNVVFFCGFVFMCITLNMMINFNESWKCNEFSELDNIFIQNEKTTNETEQVETNWKINVEK